MKGLTNTITAVKNAFLAQSPLILLGGATATLLKGRGKQFFYYFLKKKS